MGWFHFRFIGFAFSDQTQFTADMYFHENYPLLPNLTFYKQ